MLIENIKLFKGDFEKNIYREIPSRISASKHENIWSFGNKKKLQSLLPVE